MCLAYDEKQTKEMAADLKSGSVVAYKGLWVATDGEVGVLDSLHSSLYGHTWAPGDNVSSRESVVPGQDSMDAYGSDVPFQHIVTTTCKRQGDILVSINRGMHVFLNREDAEEWCDRPQEVVVEVTCRAEHFVACDKYRTKAVFTEVHLSEEEYDEAIKGNKSVTQMRIWDNRKG
jgi:hypothetical protein